MLPEELDEVVDFLMERIETQEKTELFHLQNFHKTLERYGDGDFVCITVPQNVCEFW